MLSWTHVVCTSSEYAVVSGNDTVTCVSCPEGGSCAAETALPVDDLQGVAGLLTGVVVQQAIPAQPGYWATSTSDDLAFYSCPVAEACIGGVCMP